GLIEASVLEQNQTGQRVFKINIIANLTLKENVNPDRERDKQQPENQRQQCSERNTYELEHFVWILQFALM
ncbi:MAG: hypothetical protein KC444_02295, partial [Nitrosopumilus sp.]|nr:hypothetical protein [Nitrosopumilus sp.]